MPDECRPNRTGLHCGAERVCDTCGRKEKGAPRSAPFARSASPLREVQAEQLLAEQHERLVADGALAVDLHEGSVRATEVGEEHPAIAQRDPRGLPGVAVSNTAQINYYNYALHLIHHWNQLSWLDATTSVGYERDRRSTVNPVTVGYNLLSGVGIPTVGTVQNNYFYETKQLDQSFYINEQAITLDSKLTLNLGVAAERSTNDGDINPPNRNAVSIDTTVTNGGSWYYVVSALNGIGESADSAVVIASPRPPPSLTVSSGSGHLLFSWPTSATGFTAYGASNLNPPIQWRVITNVPGSNNGLYLLSLPIDSGKQFFRLQSP